MRWTRVVAGLAVLASAGCGGAGPTAGDTPARPPDTSAHHTPPTAAPTTMPPRPSSHPPSSRPSSSRPARRPGESNNPALTPVLWHGPRDRPRVALTFDADLTAAMRKRLDSGRVGSYYNAELIAGLRRLRVPATLFLTGMWMERYPDRTRELAADPLFELATHSYSHRAFVKRCYTLGTVPREQMLSDVRQAIQILDRLDPGATRWFRFPGACYDATALHELAPAGVTAVQLDVAGGDGRAVSARAIADRVVRQSRNGSIVVLHMHGGDTAPLTDDALPAMVKGLRDRGFELVTVSSLLGP